MTGDIERLNSNDVEMEKYEYCNKVKLSSKRTTGKEITLNAFGEMLGFRDRLIVLIGTQ